VSLHLDPRMPPPEACVLRDLVERRARETPDRLFAIFPDGRRWTCADALREATAAANALHDLGVRQGEAVLSWLPNGADATRVWFGLNFLGAIYAPVNLAYRGRLLEHVVAVSDARLMVAHADLVPRLADIRRERLRSVVAIGGDPAPIDGLEGLAADALDGDGATPPPLVRPIAPWDTQSIIFTSGTTGPSKGVLSSYMHLYSMATAAPFLGPTDRYMVNLPMFHVGGTMPVTAMLVHGGSISVVEAFDTRSFWPTVRETGITTTILLGVMAGFLLKQPEAADDREHPLKSVTFIPYNDLAAPFRARFGCDLYSHFNMTEVSMPIISQANPATPGSAGRPRPGVSVRIVDENDCEVADGQVGELVVRTDCPWALNHGYAKDPEATARAWRNGWFHTGDGLRRNADGDYFFVDRMKDAIRRRGENISSFEVESEVMAHPMVKEAAVVAVPNPVAEDDVMAVVALKEGASLDPAELIDFLRPRLAHFMVPRYVRIVTEMPRTPTQKIEKHVLRSAGVDDTVWDREAAGISVKREKITLVGPDDAA